MLQSLQKYYVADNCIYMPLVGLVNGGRAVSRIISNYDLGWETIRISVRLRTGVDLAPTGLVRLVFSSSENGVWFDNDSTGAQFRDYVVTADNTDYVLSLAPDLDIAGPFWFLTVVNNTGADFNTNRDLFGATYSASKHMLVDRFDFFYKAQGKIGFAGDATETRFPFVTEMTGGLGITGIIRDFSFIPAGKLLRNQISGLASVETFPLPATEGKMGFTGTFGGPTANP